MFEQKIDATHWVEEGLLRIVDIRGLRLLPNQLEESVSEAIKVLVAGVKAPYRMVCTLMKDIKDFTQIEANMRIESSVQEAFTLGVANGPLSDLGSLNGSLMCSYDISNIQAQIHGKWLMSLLKNHDAAIFAPKSGDGIVLAGS